MTKLHCIFLTLLLFISPIYLMTQPTEIDLDDPENVAEVDVVIYGDDDHLGISGLAKGDFNGDNIDDLLIASQWERTGPSDNKSSGGEVQIFFGSGTIANQSVRDLRGIEGTVPDVVIYGAEASGQLTRNGAFAIGDVNGDGTDDLILGAPPASSGASDVYVVLGSNSLASTIDLASDSDVHIEGPTGFTHLGLESLITAGDINNDGRDDILIGSPFTGSTYVVYGATSLPASIDFNNNEQDVTINLSAGSFGSAALVTGDVNGDNTEDIILGIPGENSVYVIYGSSSLPATINFSTNDQDVLIQGATSSDNLSSGGNLKIGDFNNDSTMDIFVAAPTADGPSESRSNAGEGYIIFGSNSLPSTISLASGDEDVLIYGATSGDRLGDTNTCTVGDLNNDNIDDLILGAWRGDGPSNSRSDAGDVYVIFGSNSLSGTFDLNNGDEDIVIYGTDGGDHLSRSGITVGDLNNDNFGDLIINAFPADGPNNSRANVSGEVHVVYGSNSMPATIDLGNDEGDMVIYGGSADEFSASTSLRYPSFVVGDFNNDGKDDLAAAAFDADGPSNARSDAGEAYMFLSTSSLAEISLALNGSTNLTEGGGSFTFRFSRTGGNTDSSLTVNFSIEGGVSDGDFTVTTGGTGLVNYTAGNNTGNITFPATVTTVDLIITPNQDTEVENSENLIVKIEPM